MYKLAQTISNICNPLIISVLILTALAYYTSENLLRTASWFILGIIFIAICSLVIVAAVKKDIFSNFDISRKKDRPLFFLVSSIVMVILIGLGLFIGVSDNIIVLFTIALLSIVVYAVVTRFIKASVHLGVFVFFATIMTFLYSYWFGLLYFFVPILAWARVREKEHTISEVIVGSVLGLLLGSALVFLVQ